jgi:hypothetical protein
MDFMASDVGAQPTGWSCGSTGGGRPVWTVERDVASATGLVLRQSGQGRFPWCVKDDSTLADGSVEVRFMPQAGREDQAGGVVWRFKDGDNYYVARANALENNVSLYYTLNGSRHTIKYVNAPVPRNQWHTLRVDFKGSRMHVSLNGKTYIEEHDAHLEGAGKVGVWTKADSVTAFADFTYKRAGQ